MAQETGKAPRLEFARELSDDTVVCRHDLRRDVEPKAEAAMLANVPVVLSAAASGQRLRESHDSLASIARVASTP
jgi:hypothetical protein